MLVLGNAAGAAVKNVSQILAAKAVECLLHFALRQRGDRIAIVFLIAGQGQRVKSERVIFRRRDLFFNQRAQDASFRCTQLVHAADYTKKGFKSATSEGGNVGGVSGTFWSSQLKFNLSAADSWTARESLNSKLCQHERRYSDSFFSTLPMPATLLVTFGLPE